MADMMPSSSLLEKIYRRAEELCRMHSCSAVTRDYLVVAAIQTLKNSPEAKQGEGDLTAKLLDRFSWDDKDLERVIEAWKGKNVPMDEKLMLSMQRSRAFNVAKGEQKNELTADVLLKIILGDETPAMKQLHAGGKNETPSWMAALTGSKSSAQRPAAREQSQAQAQSEAPAPSHKSRAASRTEPDPALVSEITKRTRTLRDGLMKVVMGQAHAVSIFTAGFFQAEMQYEIEKERKKPRATFLFAGPPGVGKTFLSEEAAKLIGLPFKRFDMSEYTDSYSAHRLMGTEKSFHGATGGQLTQFVKDHPKCIILFDEIEKAHISVIQLFLQVLDAGRMTDSNTGETVNMSDTILIFTTNAGRKLYKSDNTGNLSMLSREVVLDALREERNPVTNEPFFPAAICSRFASGNVVMFNHLDAHCLHRIVRDRLNVHVQELKDATGIEVEISPDVVTAVLLSEGADADARTVKGRADAFFSTELYELFRLLREDQSKSVKKIRFSVDLAGTEKKISDLFIPSSHVHALLYSDQDIQLEGSDVYLPVFHHVQTLMDARSVMETEDVQLAVCNMFSETPREQRAFLNYEDIDSPARDFFFDMLERYPSVPLVLAETSEHQLTEEERESFMRRGVRGFVNLDAPDAADVFRDLSSVFFQQASLVTLARANQLVTFETAQHLQDDGTVDVLLFDMTLEKAVRAGDADKVSSMMSIPDKYFDDVIGADDAKRELGFFIDYMKNPKKHRNIGAHAPKGLLLYGPPGTGKTLLAKAFAAECGASFIATTGSDFHPRYIGQGTEIVRNVFATARRYAPSVIFIDEIDTVGRKRTGETGGSPEAARDSENILTTLFDELDGFNEHPDKPVFVLGATNYDVDPNSPMAMDEGLLRRLSRHILVDLPTKENRLLFLQRQRDAIPALKNISDTQLQSLAERSPGMSLSNMSSMLDLAVRNVMMKGNDTVQDDELDDAFEQFNNGDKKVWSQDAVMRVARHEAGHALLSWLAGDKPAYVTITSRSNFGGYMQHSDSSDKMLSSREELCGSIRTALGGRAAELLYYGPKDGVTTGASADLQSATRKALTMITAYGMDSEFGLAAFPEDMKNPGPELRARVNEILRAEMANATEILTKQRKALDALIDALMAKSSLKANEVDEIFSSNIVE